MAAFRNQHRIGDLLAAPHPADESVRRAVQPHGGEVADRDDPAQLARVDDLLDLDEVGVVSQDVAHADDDPFAPGRFGDTAAFGQRLGDRLFEQDVVTRLDGLHAGFEVHVLGRADQDGVGRNGVFEKNVRSRRSTVRASARISRRRRGGGCRCVRRRRPVSAGRGSGPRIPGICWYGCPPRWLRS